MLIYHTDNLGADPRPQINTRFTKFYDQMKGLVGGDGYPKKCKKIAASLGSFTGVGQSYTDQISEEWTNFTGAPRTQNAIAFVFDAVQNSPFAGYGIAGRAAPLAYNISPNPNYTKWGVMSISINSAIYNSNYETAYPNASIPADIMPGSFTPVFRLVAQALSNLNGNSRVWMDNGCFIPTLSALDFNSDNWFHNISAESNPASKTPFSSIFAGRTNRNHAFPVTNNNALVNWVVNEINTYGATMNCTTPQPPSGCNFTEGQYLATFAASGEQIFAHYCGSTLYATTSAGAGGGFKPRHWIEAIGYSQFACFAEDQPTNCSAQACNFNVSVSNTNSNPSANQALQLNYSCSGSDCNGVGYAWSGNGVSGSSSPLSISAPGSNGSYTYTVTASKNGCSNKTATTSITVGSPNPSGCNFTEGQYLATFAATGEQIYAHYCGSTLYATTSAGAGGGFKPRSWIEAIGFSQFACFVQDQPNLANCTTTNPPNPSGCTFTEGQYLATFAATGEQIYAHYCGSTLYATTSVGTGGGFKPRSWIEAIGFSQFACFAETQPNFSNCGNGGGTGGSSFSQCIEAESSSGSGAITSDPAASNGQTRGEENNYNHYVDYSVTGVPSSGNYTVTLRYYSSAVPVIGVKVNGGSTQSITLPNTNSWNIAWSDYTFTVNLNAGSNTIRILGVSGGSCRQDRICVT